ncbi:MAG TPA: DMT family transporter [Gaiellaceae bacterium]|nr:DMT family transporter [Gaiellaceae bacterium]
MEALAIPLLLVVGGLLVVQAAANVQLSGAVASPFGASTLQLAIAALVLALIAALVGSLDALGRLGHADPWTVVGGLGSAIYITAGVLLFPRLGAIVAAALIIAGQMLASLLLDGFGWLGVARTTPRPGALLGVVAIVVGAWLIVRAQRQATAIAGTARARAGWIALALLAGAVLPVQGAVNARLDADLHAPIAVGAFSFLIATAAMAFTVAAIVSVGGANRPSLAALPRVPWWGWLGGLVGATYVTSVFLLIPRLGAAPVVALTVGGQQIASVLVDRLGLLRLPRRQVPRLRLVGVTVLLVGVLLVTAARS